MFITYVYHLYIWDLEMKVDKNVDRNVDVSVTLLEQMLESDLQLGVAGRGSLTLNDAKANCM